MTRELIPTTAFGRAVRKFLKRHPQCAQSIEETLDALSADAFAPKLRTHKLKGDLDGVWACGRVVLATICESCLTLLKATTVLGFCFSRSEPMIPFTDLTILKSEALESARAGVCAQDFNSSRFHHTA